MKDREKTDLLTKICYLYLRDIGCFEIGTEIHIPYYGLRDYTNEADKHYNIDLVGINWKYLPPSKQYIKKIVTEAFSYDNKVIKEPTLRGIEIKVSRSDFNNGFVHVGCNYNYLMTPKGLIDKKEVHKDIGIIEVDLENLSLRKRRPPWYGVNITGITHLRKPKFKEVSDKIFNKIQGQIGYKLTLQTARWVRDELLQNPSLTQTGDEKDG